MPSVNIPPGQRVRVVAGPLKEYTGVIVSQPSPEKSLVQIQDGIYVEIATSALKPDSKPPKLPGPNREL